MSKRYKRAKMNNYKNSEEGSIGEIIWIIVQFIVIFGMGMALFTFSLQEFDTVRGKIIYAVTCLFCLIMIIYSYFREVSK